jgi:small-conductance mechanosensitive channel
MNRHCSIRSMPDLLVKLRLLRYPFWNHLLHSIITLLLLIVIGMIFYLFIVNRKDDLHARQTLRYRIIYISVFLYALLLSYIWIEGLGNLLTVLSLVGVGLVVANKETVMNFVGSLIINWRDLFAEGDRIQLEEYTGYVQAIGVLYFTLREINPQILSRPTGRLIRIPNGLVITQPVINFSQQANLLEYNLNVTITTNSNVDKIEKILITAVRQTIVDFYKNNPEYVIRKKRNVEKLLEHDPVVSLDLSQHSPPGIKMTVYYHCYARDQNPIANLIYKKILAEINSSSDITLI